MPRKYFSVIPRINMSLLTSDERQIIYQLLEKHGVRLCSITPTQRLLVYGISRESSQNLEKELAHIIPLNKGITVTYVHACPGVEECRYAIANALQLGRRLEALSFPSPFPHKVKIAIAGCTMCCTEPYVRDIGIVAKRNGWSVIFGGNGGGRPRIGDLLAEGLQGNEVTSLVEKALLLYLENSSKKQRTSRFIEQFGIDRFKEILF